MNTRFIVLVSAALTLGNWKAGVGQEPVAPAESWSGKWHGALTDAPARPDAKSVDVTMEIGPWPGGNDMCTMWRTTYAESGVVRQVKDYRLCRGERAEEWFIDEGGGTKLTARWIGSVLVSPFKVGTFLIVATVRLNGDTLDEEILTVEDTPGGSLLPQSIQRIELKRVSPAP